MTCPECDGAGVIEVCYGNNPDACAIALCPLCGEESAGEVYARERDEDDGLTYADPRDEMAERLERD